MKNFLFDIFIISLILFCVDFSVGKIANKLIENLKESSYFGEINRALKEIKPDVLIIGASRAKSHYVPTIFSESLNMTVYNAGSDGKNILYHSCIANAVIKRKPPKIIIVELNIEEFQVNFYERLSVLNPFYDYDQLCHETVNLKSKTEWIKMKSNLYKYNSIFLTIINNRFKGGENKNFGYRALPVGTIITYPGKIENREIIDSVVVNRFIWLIDKCKQNNIKVVISLSPYYGIIDSDLASVKVMEAICYKKAIPFFNYSQSEYFIKHPELFKDINHLNHIGAETYTKMIVKDLKLRR